MGDKFHSKLTGKHLVAGDWVKADVGGDETFDAVLADKPAKPLVGHAAGNRDRVNILHALFQQSGNDFLGREFTVPVAKHDRLAIAEFCKGLFFGHYL